MIGYTSIVLLAVAFQVVSSQEPPGPPGGPPGGPPPHIPPQCRRPPEGVVEKPQDCCKIPQFFADADFEECGFKKLEDHERPPERRGPPDCSKQLCMMKKYSLLKDDTEIDYEAMSKFMDTWGEANPDFKSSANSARERCIGKPLPGPPHVCEANKIVFCVSSTLIEECPKWEETEGCQKVKSHIEECTPYFRFKH